MTQNGIFFATSHGKGPSDGVGGTVKREATGESLRRPYDSQIISPKDLFAFAENSLNEMKFGYGIQEAYGEEERNLEERLKTAKTTAGTQKLHAFIPISETALQVREFSLSEEHRIESAISKSTPTFNGNSQVMSQCTMMENGGLPASWKPFRTLMK